MVHIGRYTAALLLIATGLALVSDQTTDSRYLVLFIDWWPILFIVLGLETIFLSLIYKHKGAKLRFSFGSVAGVAVITIVILLLTNFGEEKFGDKGWRFWENAFQQHTMPVQQVALQDGTEQIRVRNKNGKIHIRSGSVEHVRIEPIVHYPKFLPKDLAEEVEQDSRVRITEGETLEITAEGKEYWRFFWRQKARIDLTITIPNDEPLNVQLELSNGDATATELHLKDQLYIRTSNGDIQVANIQGGLNVTTKNGDIRAVDTSSSSIMRTNNGDIVLENASSSVDATTSNGDVEVYAPASDLYIRTNNGEILVDSNTVGGNWQLETKNGDISLAVPQQGSYRIRGFGKIHTSLDWLDVRRRSVAGQLVDGRYVVEVETKNGEIEIKHAP